MLRQFFILTAFSLGAAAMAQIDATGSISYVNNGSNYTYDITLHNTGTTTIGTMWYAWTPGQDYLPIAPSSHSGPANWTFTQTTSAGFGFGLRWVAQSGSLLQPGQSISGFSFTTTTTPTELLGNTIFGTHPPVGTTFIYQGGPFVGQSKQILINPVPEPATALVMVPGLALMARRRRSRA